VIVSDAPAPARATVIQYQDARNKAEAQTYAPVVGPATIAQGDERIDGVDATIILGKDFATFAQPGGGVHLIDPQPDNYRTLGVTAS